MIQPKPLEIIKKLVLVELVFYFLFLLLALSADWGELYLNLKISNYLSFTVLEFALLAVLQVALIYFVLNRSLTEKDIHKVILEGEHERLEFKSTLRWDLGRGQVNKDLERSAMKTIAAFLNSDGGELIIGVGDKGEVRGLGSDMASLIKKNQDGFENHFNNVFISMIGPEFRSCVHLNFHTVKDVPVCLVSVKPAPKPAYVKTEKGEDFFIRTGNSTTSLKMSQVASYVSSWWH